MLGAGYVKGETSKESLSKLRVMVFPGGFNLPLWAAQANGFFEQEGLSLEISFTRGSVQQIEETVAGKHDIAMTGMDNIVAYQEGQGEAKLDRDPDLFAFMGSDNAFLHLVVQKDIHSYADLKGKTLSVDALTTGFAFVLRRMLATGGLSENDYTLESAGGVMQRWGQLKEGKHAGTLLLTPFEIIGQQLGLRDLQSASAVLPHYQGVVGAASRSWAQANPGKLIAYIRAYVAGLDWLYDRRNKTEAIALLVKNIPNMSTELAQAAYDIFLADKGGFEPKARLDIEGIQTVLELRSNYGVPKKLLTKSEAYYDMSYYQRAMEAN